jgi:hypothetical protein
MTVPGSWFVCKGTTVRGSAVNMATKFDHG